MRIIRCKNSLTVVFSGGRVIQTNECDDALFEKVKELKAKDDEFELINLLVPETNEKGINKVRLIKFLQSTEQSSELTHRNDAVYWDSVSPLSLPMSFAEKIMKAEKQGNADRLEAYRNFWTLLSLNQDSVVRENLFKFLDKWGMAITKSGLFVGYRNVAKKSGAGPDVYTDQHSHTFTITIGKMVTMPREECDADSGHECSNGLHIGGTSWLEKGYYGDTGLVCLVNPVDVVAVPWANSNYGKLRTCAYLPIAKAEYKGSHIVPFRTDSGFEAPFVPTILYDGVMATEKSATYVIEMPKDPTEAKSVSSRLLAIARKFMDEK